MATLQQTTPLLRAGQKRPNILITGTPGTGKTTTARYIAVRLERRQGGRGRGRIRGRGEEVIMSRLRC